MSRPDNAKQEMRSAGNQLINQEIRSNWAAISVLYEIGLWVHYETLCVFHVYIFNDFVNQ